MRFRLPAILTSRYAIALIVGVALLIVLAGYTFLAPIAKGEETQIVYIDTDDTIDSIYYKVSVAAGNDQIHGFKILARYAHYGDQIRTGAYAVEPAATPWALLRRLRRGQQQPVRVVIPATRGLDRLASTLARQLMVDSLTVITLLTDSATCEQYGYNTATIACMIVPNTYEFYWDVDAESLLRRLQTESQLFWNATRQRQAHDLRLTPVEVVTLASIVDEETANSGEMPTIAGLYYNRLQMNMRLQADPTVLFANNAYGQRRVHGSDLTIDSPYNTYLYPGLPPGPIRIPSTTAIDAVLNMQHHNYIYMCAKEDFSGTHNFAATYAEHKDNARRYKKALNERGIK